jgi:hypothetical protein
VPLKKETPASDKEYPVKKVVHPAIEYLRCFSRNGSMTSKRHQASEPHSCINVNTVIPSNIVIPSNMVIPANGGNPV